MKMNKNLIEENLKIEYERVNGSSFMTIETDKSFEDSYQIKMIVKNELEHFLKITNASVNNRHFLKYDISKRQQLAQFYEYEKMKLEDVRLLCSNISEMVRLVDEYMLDLDYVLLDPNFIFMDVITKNLNFIYLPSLKNSNFTDNLRSVFEYVLEHFDHTMDKTSVVFLYEFYQYILSNKYDPYNLLKLYNELHDKMFAEVEVNTEAATNYSGEQNKEANTNYSGEQNTEATTNYSGEQNIKATTNYSEEQNTEAPSNYSSRRNIQDSLEETVIDTISKEEILLDDPEKDNLKANNKLLVVGLIFTIISLTYMLFPKLLPIVIPKSINFVVLIVGVFCLYLYKKSVDKLREMPDLVAEEIPYVAKERSVVSQPSNTFEQTEMKKTTPIQKTNKSFSTNKVYPADNNISRKSSYYVEDNISVDTVLLSDFVKKRQAKEFKLIFKEDSIGLIESIEKSMAFKNQEDVSLDLDKKEICFKKFPMVMGNFKEVADIFFDSKLVSRMHASIKKEDGKYIFEDLNSSNGSFINGERLENKETRELTSGDIITIASVSFEVEIS